MPVLEKLGKTVTYFGPSGAGQAAKATNQIMCAGIIQAVGEAMAFAHAEGLPLDRLIETLGKGAGSSWYFVNRAPFMANNSFPAGFSVRLHAKDLRICRDMAAKRGAELPVVESTLQQYAQLIVQGFGDEDISAIYRLVIGAVSREQADLVMSATTGLVIATRKSKLALWQAEHVAALLRRAHPALVGASCCRCPRRATASSIAASPPSAARDCSSRNSSRRSRKDGRTWPSIR